VQKPEALTTSGRSEVQKYKPHDNSHLQLAGGGQSTPAESGQSHRLGQAESKVLFLQKYFRLFCLFRIFRLYLQI